MFMTCIIPKDDKYISVSERDILDEIERLEGKEEKIAQWVSTYGREVVYLLDDLMQVMYNRA